MPLPDDALLLARRGRGVPLLLRGRESFPDGFHIENSAEGGTNGVNVTTGNSGGVSGEPFSNVVTSGGALTYSSAWTMDTLAYRVNQTTGASVFGDLGSFPAQRHLFLRQYIFLENFSTATARIWAIRSASALLGGVEVIPTRFLQIVAGSGATIATGVKVLPSGRWFRIEMLYDTNPAGVLMTARLYLDPNSATFDEEISGGAVSGTDATIARFGVTVNSVPFSYHFDNIGVTNQGWLGPLGTAGFREDYFAGPGGRVPKFIRHKGPRLIIPQRLEPAPPPSVTTTITVDVAGAITLAGADVPLTTTIVLTPGAITLTGQAIALSTTIVPTPGAITLTGQSITIQTKIVPTPGAITLTGQAVTLSITITPTPGALTLTGQAIALSTKIVLTPGAITLTGQSVGILNTITVTPGALTLAGQAVVLKNIQTITPGNITLTGSNITIPAPPIFLAAHIVATSQVAATLFAYRAIIPETRIVAAWSENRSLKGANMPGKSWGR